MITWLTELPWGWYAGGLVLAVGLIYGAAYYEAVKAPAEYHDYCAQVDREIDMDAEFESEIAKLLAGEEIT